MLNHHMSPAVICLLVVMVCVSVPSGRAESAEPTTLTEEQKTLYALGLAVAQQLGPFVLNTQELELVQKGISDSVLGNDPVVDLQAYRTKLQEMARRRLQASAEAEKQAAREFLTRQAAEQGAVRTDSGIVLFELSAGSGDSPSATDRVKVHYHGTLRDGTVFDSSVQRGSPVDFGLNQVVPCWREALQRMKVGGTSRIVCPPDLAYGDQGRPGIPPGAALVFEVELLEILEPTAPPADS